jgi:(1->4)-alpha-D-glucan 1-alpha-D-glucosylmutase
LNRHDPALSSTYRVQLGPDLDLKAAAELVPYLRRLGVSHVYTSPVLQAAPGSTHGYDVVDHSAVSAELGGEEAHARLVETLREAGMGMVLDLVPNHMASAGRHNRWWWDVLENGHSSRHAHAFDIAWDPPERRLRNTILMPVLGDHYGRVLERGELKLDRDGGQVLVRYFEHEFPLAVDSLDGILRAAAALAGSRDLDDLAERCVALPEPDPERAATDEARHIEKEAIKERLAALCAGRSALAAAVDEELASMTRDQDRLDALLSRQNYRLARWQTATSELDYRRFFDIDTLIGLRMEDERVFRDSHALVLRWFDEGRLQGLRIDHVDGLRDPEGYLRRLQLEAPAAWVVVEKILEAEEKLPRSWPVAGTTGYDFARLAGGLFIDPAGEEPMTRTWQRLGGIEAPWPEISHGARQEVMRDLLAADVLRLGDAFMRVCERNRRFRDFTRQEVLEALRELLACMPVYRTYVRPEAQEVSDDDRAAVERAVAEATERQPDLDRELFEFLTDVLLLRHRGKVESEFVARFQQTSGPVMAKGVEDTAFYRYHRLISLNEVGGDPAMFAISPERFHEECRERAGMWPRAMLSSSTHDTKRSEDVRCRLALLSEIPERWSAAVHGWSARGRLLRQGSEWPDPATEYLIYQTLVGAWPLGEERLEGFLVKAMREAKVHTSWLSPHEEYEAAVLAFGRAVLADGELRSSIEAFVDSLLVPGWMTSLALKLLTLTAPGVPDVYQGTELWDLSLVDPDNRRPVDFDLRFRLLDELEDLSPEAVWERAAEGLPKLLVTSRALRLRRRLPDAFAGRYEALVATGEEAGHLVGYLRGDRVAVLVPRLAMSLRGWGETTVELPAGSWRHELRGTAVEGGRRRVADLLEGFPVGLLSR